MLWLFFFSSVVEIGPVPLTMTALSCFDLADLKMYQTNLQLSNTVKFNCWAVVM